MNFEAAEKVIRFLDKRGGFDAWWEDIDRDTRQEIKEGLAELLSESRGDLRTSERQGADERGKLQSLFSGFCDDAFGGEEQGEAQERLFEVLNEAFNAGVNSAGFYHYAPSQPAPSADAAMARWVPVSERLPATCDTVVVLNNDGNRELAWRSAVGWYGQRDALLTGVTHWMPIPAHPEVKP